MHNRQLIAKKPAYRHGQLLLEEDFIAEQRFHLDARRLHARMLHGFGVVHGLEVTPSDDFAVTVAPGFAVDRDGREIHLREAETLTFQGLPAGAAAVVTIGYRTERVGGDGEGGNRIGCWAQVRIETGVEPSDVRLASVRLDGRGRFARVEAGADFRDALPRVAAGSVVAESLGPQLRCGWIDVAFHPTPMPQDEDDARPPFRVGATQALAHREYNGKPNTRGAAGTMPFYLPPGVQYVHQLRIAGGMTEGKLTAVLVKGGFDPTALRHLRDEVATIQIDAGKDGYLGVGKVADGHARLHGPHGSGVFHRTLSVDVRALGYAAVSLVSIEVSY